MRHAVRDSFCLVHIACVFDDDAHKFGRAFAVAHDQLRQFLRHFNQRLSEYGVFGLARRNVDAARTTGHDDE